MGCRVLDVELVTGQTSKEKPVIFSNFSTAECPSNLCCADMGIFLELKLHIGGN
jgi:hypothetical protein